MDEYISGGLTPGVRATSDERCLYIRFKSLHRMLFPIYRPLVYTCLGYLHRSGGFKFDFSLYRQFSFLSSSILPYETLQRRLGCRSLAE